MSAPAARSPHELLCALDLGPGGYARAPAKDAKAAAKKAILRKHRPRLAK
jgi:hypothetical protein